MKGDARHGHSDPMKVGVHMLAYVDQTTQEAADVFYPIPAMRRR